MMFMGYAGYRFFWAADKTAFLPGETTHGHYQIELACSACHDPFMGVKENACYECHDADLKAGNDSHPKAKFEDPRNADRLEKIDAAHCVTCHAEHRPEITLAMGVTQPADYCFHCHEDIATERPSHAGMAFDTCATAGCHHFHDNTALYEDFLLKHADEPAVIESPRVAGRNFHEFILATESPAPRALARADVRLPDGIGAADAVWAEWESSAHARAGVDCMDCHMVSGEGGARVWASKPPLDQCAVCHEKETSQFHLSRHGMRLAQGMSPMRPEMARLPMRPEAEDREMTCVACHGAHDFNATRAAVESCLQCHDDAHSRAYRDSAHYDLWQRELGGELPAGSGVSCATCHLPRETHREEGRDRVRVQHNQNNNLRPADKMLRSVCLDCHGLGFSIDALADSQLMKRNFQGTPSRHVPSIDMAVKSRREKEERKRDVSPAPAGNNKEKTTNQPEGKQ